MSWAREARPSVIDQKPSSLSAFMASLLSVAMICTPFALRYRCTFTLSWVYRSQCQEFSMR